MLSDKHRGPAVVGFTYFFGYICASFLSFGLCLIFACILAAVFILFKRLDICGFRRHIPVMAAALLVFGFYNRLVIEPVRSLEGASAAVTGIVTERTAPENDNIRLTVNGEAGGIPVRLTLYAEDSGIEVGDKISFSAEFSALNDSADFSETDYYFSRGIFIKARAADEITVLSHSFSLGAAVSDFSDKIKSGIRYVLSEEESSVLCAVFFGDKTGLSDMQSVLLRRSGLSHIAAVSGMHLSLVVHTLRTLFLEKMKRRRLLRCALTSAMIVFLMMFFGMTSSVLRSGIMLLIYYGGELFLRKSNPLNSIGAALFIIVVFQPFACRDVGLWLSALGTIGVGVVAPRICDGAIKSQRLRSVKESLIGSAAALFCTLPVSMLSFGGVSLVSPFSTPAVYPAFMAAMLLMLANLFTGGLFVEAFMLPAGFCARAMNLVFDIFGSLPFGYIETEGLFWQQLSAVTVFGMLAVLALTGKLEYFIRFSSVSLCVIISAAVLSGITDDGRIKISLYSDGADGMAVIRSKSGVSFLSTGDSGKITAEMLSCGIGERVLLVCAAKSSDNNVSALSQLNAIELHTPESPNMKYDASGEYTVTVKDGGIYIDACGVSVSLTKIDSVSDADFAVYSGYRKNREAGVNYSEIFFDKRMKDGHNAYYDKIEITIDDEGGVLFSKGGIQ